MKKELTMTKEKKIKTADKCNTCNELYTAKNVQLKDHCPVTCKYSSSANKSSYVNFRLTNISCYPAVLQNLRGYKNPLIIEKTRQFRQSINVIPNSMEKQMVVKILKKFTFIDSFSIMNSNLASLVKNWLEDGFSYMFL